MTRKNELIIQAVIFGMTAFIVSFLISKAYPSSIIKIFKNSKSPTVSQAEKAAILAEKIYPASINIDSLSLNLTISPGIIKDNRWTLFDDKVSWLSTSGDLIQGNIILYAHNKPNLFGDLTQLEIGDEIIIEGSGKKQAYVVREKRKVLPTDIEAVVSDKNELTLYTCNGSFDEKRLIVKADPKADSLSLAN